jgi:hypothetical protein
MTTSPQGITDEGPTSDRDKADMIAARREVQAILDGRLPMDNAAYSAAIAMVLWKAGWRPRHLSTSMDRCDIADGWWRLGQGWRKRFQKAQDEADRLRTELAEAPSRRDLLVAEERMRSAELGQHKAEVERDALAASLAAVDELHQPYDTPDDPHASRRCKGCIAGYDPRTGDLVRCAWPCPTKRARAALGEDGGTDR